MLLFWPQPDSAEYKSFGSPGDRVRWLDQLKLRLQSIVSDRRVVVDLVPTAVRELLLLPVVDDVVWSSRMRRILRWPLRATP